MNVIGIQTSSVYAKVNLINCFFAIDTSGSMAGSKLKIAQAGVIKIFNQLTSGDYCGIMTFNNEVTPIAYGVKSDISNGMNRFSRMTASGGTALYDAIIQSVIMSLEIHSGISKLCQSVITYLIVLTDGEDTSSKLNKNRVKDLLKEANKVGNFKIILAGIRLDSTAQGIMREFGNIGDSDIEFKNLTCDADIENMFEHISIGILQRTAIIGTTSNQANAIRAPAPPPRLPPSNFQDNPRWQLDSETTRCRNYSV
eukprot:gene31218-41594_t